MGVYIPRPPLHGDGDGGPEGDIVGGQADGTGVGLTAAAGGTAVAGEVPAVEEREEERDESGGLDDQSNEEVEDTMPKTQKGAVVVDKAKRKADKKARKQEEKKLRAEQRKKAKGGGQSEA